MVVMQAAVLAGLLWCERGDGGCGRYRYRYRYRCRDLGRRDISSTKAGVVVVGAALVSTITRRGLAIQVAPKPTDLTTRARGRDAPARPCSAGLGDVFPERRRGGYTSCASGRLSGTILTQRACLAPTELAFPWPKPPEYGLLPQFAAAMHAQPRRNTKHLSSHGRDADTGGPTSGNSEHARSATLLPTVHCGQFSRRLFCSRQTRMMLASPVTIPPTRCG
jgi:hypothetical protein